jgi:hypothetical protein
MKSNLMIKIFSMIVTVTITASSIHAADDNSSANSESGTVTLDNLTPVPEGKTEASESPYPSQGSPYNDSPGYSVIPGGVGSSQVTPFGPWVSFEGQFGNGLGWDENNYFIKSFFPKHIDPGKSLFFLTLNGNVTDNSGGGMNAGFGFRQYSYSHNRIFGASVLFDYDSGYENTYKQIGLSLESIGKYVTMRLNHYHSIGDDSNVLSSGRVSDDLVFFGNYLGFNNLSVIENQYNNTEFLIGGPLPYLGRKGVEGYVGGYYLNHSDADDAVGFKFTVNSNVTENMKVGVNFTNDEVFGTNTYVSLSYLFPHKHPARWFKPQKVRPQLQAPLQRENRIAVKTDIVRSLEALINPADGMPFHFIHVDPSLTTGSGTGRIESPYGDLETARLGNRDFVDVIRVLPNADGSGTDLATTVPFRLFDDQRMLGTTFEHSITGVQGTFTIPGFTGAGDGPLISSLSGGSVVELANRNEVNGFRIDGSGGARSGISQPFGTVVDSFTLANNVFQGVINGIDLTNAEGTGSISTSTFADSTVDGIRLINDAPGAPLILSVTGNTFATAAEHGFHYGSSVGSDTLTITGNTFVSNVAGDLLVDLSGTAAVGTIIDGNTFDSGAAGARSPGASIVTTGASAATTSIIGNTFTDNTDAIVFDTSGASTSVASVTGNTITDNTNSGIAGTTSGSGLLDLTIDSNIITENASTAGSAGILLTSNATSTLRGSITSNDISDQVDGPGVFMIANGASRLDFGSIATRLVAGNTFNGNADAGFAMFLNDTSRGNLNFTTNTVTGTRDGTNALLDGNGVHIRTEENSILETGQFTFNTIGASGNGNVGNGLFVEMFQSSRAPDIDVLSNVMSFNTLSGFKFDRFADAFLDDVVVDRNTFNNNGVDGMWLVMNGGNIDPATLLPFTIDFAITNNTASDNGANGFHFQTVGDADLVATLDTNILDSNGLSGIYGDTSFFSSLSGVWSNTTITNTAFDGILFDVGSNQGGIGAVVTLEDSLIEGSGRDGIHYNGFHGGASVITLNRNIVRNNVGDGLEINMIEASTATFITADNVFEDNLQSGIEVTAGFTGTGGANDAITDTNQVASYVLDSTRDTIQRNGDDGFSSLTTELATGSATFTDATIRFNTLRGIDVVNMDDADMTIRVLGTVDPRASAGALATSIIDSNGLQGIYLENNANRVNAATGVNPFYYTNNDMNIDIFRTMIRGNGIGGSTFADDNNGIFLRVGTAASFLGSGIVAQTNASIRETYSTGNVNVDFAVESFVANRDPNVVDPNWVDGALGSGTAAYEPDPIARLNLRYRDNVAQQVDMTRPGAFFDNADAFKSVPALFGTDSDRTRSAQQFPRASLVIAAGAVIDPPAPAEGTWDSTAAGFGDGFFVNSVLRFTGGGFAGTSRQITSYTSATGTFGINQAYGVPPFGGDTFLVEVLQVTNAFFLDAQDQSSFITEDATVAAGGNVIAPGGIISDFSTITGILNTSNPTIPDFVYFGWDTTGAFPVIFP